MWVAIYLIFKKSFLVPLAESFDSRPLLARVVVILSALCLSYTADEWMWNLFRDGFATFLRLVGFHHLLLMCSDVSALLIFVLYVLVE